MKHEIDIKHGILYDCSIDHNGIIEDTSIIPLAKELKSNRQFVMTDACRLYEQHPEYVKKIITMSFDDIMNDGQS